MNIYNITQELRAALDNIQIDDETGEITNWDAIDALNVAFEQKAEAYAVAIKEYEAMAKQVDDAAKALASRKATYMKRAASMKEHLAFAMAAVGEEKIETANAAISFRKSTAVVVDETSLPDEYWKIIEERKPDKSEIGKLLKQGVSIPGAALETRKNVQVK